MRHMPWAVTNTYVDAGERVALGRIGIGVFNQDAQPVRDAAGTLALMMAGELYGLIGAPDLHRALGVVPDEQIVLAAYERFGADLAQHLDGAFVLALYDATRQHVIVANDRCGLYPTYYAQVGDRLIFAPEVKAILLDGGVDRSLREDAVAEYVRFQRLLGVKTFFAGIEQLRPASVLTFDLPTGEVTSRIYWDLGKAKAAPSSITFDEAVEEGGRLFRSAVHRLAHGPERLGVFLSGGLDSRAILGFAAEKKGPLDTFTYGTPNSRDVYYAEQVVRAVGSRHHVYTVPDGAWIRDQMGLHIELAEGFHSWVHMHGLHMLPAVREHIDVNLSGLGDMLWIEPYWDLPYLIGAPDDLSFRTALHDFYVTTCSWPGLSAAEERNLYTDEFFKQVDGQAYDSFATELSRYAHLPIPQRHAAFNLHNHIIRHLVYHAVYGRAYVEFRLPYCELALMSFCYTLPFDDQNYSLRAAILERELPRLARIPYASDELPVTVNPRRRRVNKAVLQARKAAHAVFPRAFPGRPKFHMGYEEWLRTDLFPWAQGILLDKRTIQRGYFREEALQSLLNRVQAARQSALIGKVSHLITFELMLRRLCDGQAAAF